jgi:hypothetical protein
VRAIAEMPLSPKEKIIRLTEEMIAGIKTKEMNVYFYVFMPQVMLNKKIPKKAKPFVKEADAPIRIVRKIIIAGQQTGEIKAGNPDALATFFFASITGLCTYKLMMGKQFTLPQTDMLTAILLNK